MDDASVGPVFDMCRQLKDAFDGVLVWTWDPRFETALAEFSVQESSRVREGLLPLFDVPWDVKTVTDAPAQVQVIKQQLGGLMPGQRLYTRLLKTGPLVFGAWWPWGNGQKISLRIGCRGVDSEIGQLKACFGIKVPDQGGED